MHTPASWSPARVRAVCRGVNLSRRHRAPRRWTRATATAALLTILVAACGGDGTPALAGIVREPLPDVSTVTLPEASAGNAPMTLRAAAGGLLVVYFGYLSCPDVCPTTMADLRTATSKLPATDRAKVDVVMVTIDPGRDTADALTAYVRGFVPRGRAARTTDQVQLRAAVDAFGGDYAVKTTADGTVEVSHTAYVYVVDDRGRLRITWPFGLEAPEMQSDLHQLLTTASRGA